MFRQKVKHDYLYKELAEILKTYVKHSAKNAENFFQELGKAKGEEFIFSLQPIEQLADQKLKEAR